MVTVDSPWEHFIFDDFLTDREVAWLEELLYFFPICTENKKRVRVGFGKEFVKYAEHEQNNYFEEHRKMLSNLVKTKLLAYPEFESLKTKKVHVEYQSLGKDFAWKVHTDVPTKIFSLVLYLTREDSCGTRLYDSNQEFVYEVPWKFNRATGFWNAENHWHDFYSTADERKTLNFIFHD